MEKIILIHEGQYKFNGVNIPFNLKKELLTKNILTKNYFTQRSEIPLFKVLLQCWEHKINNNGNKTGQKGCKAAWALFTGETVEIYAQVTEYQCI